MSTREESVHAANADESWQESVFLAWYDRKARVGGIHRIGIEPNRNLSNMWCGVFSEGRSWFRLNDDQRPLELVEDGAGFICGPQSLHHDAGTVRWRLETEDCEIDLRLEDHETGDLWTGADDTVMAVATTGHYHSHCRVRGTARLGSETFKIDGDGWRDHSWGPRLWGSILHHRCFSGFLGGAASVDFGSLLDLHGNLSRYGTVVRDGRKELVEHYRFTVAVDDDGFTARSAEVVGRLPSGEPIAGRYEMAGGFVVETREYLGVESVGTVTLSTGETGFGYMAVSTNARAGRARPPLALHALGRNGYFEGTPPLDTDGPAPERGHDPGAPNV